MSKYDFKCPNCGVFTVEHAMDEKHPERCEVCGSPITRYFGSTKNATIIFVPSRGGGVDDWASRRAPAPQEQTSVMSETPYR
jgi:putative FmdB family regulatory protein